MDPSDVAFHELERALDIDNFTLDTLGETSVPSSRKWSPRLNATELSNPDDEGLMESSGDTHDETAASSPTVNGSVSGSGAGLPPTPPTPQNPKAVNTDRTSPQPNQPSDLPSGLSSPSIDWHSLPTPDPSPPGNREILPLPFYLMNRNPSTYADSFRTAKESQSFMESPESSRFQSPGIRNSPLSSVLNSGMHQRTSLAGVQYTSPDDREPHDDVVENSRHSFSSSEAANDSILSSPTIARSLSQGTAQRRLRALIQPGDAIKRPDESLMYSGSSSRTWKSARAGKLEVEKDAQPKTDGIQPQEDKGDPLLDSEGEKDLGVLPTNGAGEQDLKVDTEPVDNESEAKNDVSLDELNDKDPVTEHSTWTDQTGGGQDVLSSDFENTAQQPMKGSRSVQNPPENGIGSTEITEDAGDELLKTPLSATKSSSLEDNNVVYKLIREENVKRHSNISDGSVQAVVVAIPEQKRTLRHTPKRHSLRADVSLTSNSHRSSAESGKKSTKRHTGTTMTTSDTDLTSPDLSPMAAKATLKPTVVSHAPPVINVKPSSPQSSHAPSSAAITVVPTNTHQPLQGRALKKSIRERRFDYVDTFYDDDDDDDLNEMPRWPSPPMHQAAHMSSRPVYVPLTDLRVSPKLRKFSNESRLENNLRIRRTSLDKASVRTSQPLEIKLEQAAKELTREGQELPDDRYSFALTSAMTSPKRGSFDVFLHHPTHTSLSVSQASFRSDIELLEARGVTIFPHNNESLVLVQQGIRSAKRGDAQQNADKATIERVVNILPESTVERIEEPATSNNTADPAASVQPPVAHIDSIGRSKHTVDSPLTNPRAPPEPPIIKFIPPTPCEELESDLNTTKDRVPSVPETPQRRPSISQRVRRYSESLIQPLGRFGSLRRQQQQPRTSSSRQQRKRASSLTDSRPTYLSSFWQPRDFWEECGSDDDTDSDELFDDHDPVIADIATLPPGGDTSGVEATPASSARNFFPRNMSVRMPGFRGTGGFLLGNSLGIDRHGTNNRRHYVRRRTAEELAKRDRAAAAGDVMSTDRGLGAGVTTTSVTATAPAARNRTANFRLPFGKAATVEYVGLAPLRNHLRALRARREELAREKKRERLKMRIGTSWYHDTAIGS